MAFVPGAAALMGVVSSPRAHVSLRRLVSVPIPMPFDMYGHPL